MPQPDLGHHWSYPQFQSFGPGLFVWRRDLFQVWHKLARIRPFRASNHQSCPLWSYFKPLPRYISCWPCQVDFQLSWPACPIELFGLGSNLNQLSHSVFSFARLFLFRAFILCHQCVCLSLFLFRSSQSTLELPILWHLPLSTRHFAPFTVCSFESRAFEAVRGGRNFPCPICSPLLVAS